jgi:hypothetical protein
VCFAGLFKLQDVTEREGEQDDIVPDITAPAAVEDLEGTQLQTDNVSIY